MNLSKTRTFPEYFYSIYDLTKKERGEYINVWFPGEKININKKTGEIYCEQLWTLKSVDKESERHLYGREYNPISLSIFNVSNPQIRKTFPKDGVRYNFKIQVHSIDDSSYSVWFNTIPIEEIRQLIPVIANWIDSKKHLNGEELLEYCMKLGANEKDYD